MMTETMMMTTLTKVTNVLTRVTELTVATSAR